MTFTPLECKIMHSFVYIYSNIVFYVFKRYTYGRSIAIEYLKLDFGVSRSAKTSDFISKVRKKKLILTDIVLFGLLSNSSYVPQMLRCKLRLFAVRITTATNFRVTECRVRFYFLQHGNLLHERRWQYAQQTIATCNVTNYRQLINKHHSNL